MFASQRPERKAGVATVTGNLKRRGRALPDDVVQRMLGYDSDRIAELRAKHVI